MWLTKGHDTAVELLRRSIENQHIAHAYMFSGPQHVGKMTLALDFARALTCKSENGPCNVCNSCQLIGAGKHPDVVIINLNLAGELSRRSPDEDASTRSKIGIAHIKDIQMLANLPAYSGEYKIFIFEEAQDLSIPAANRLLKILEEPPPNVIWILLTAEKYSILPTVLSRCQNIQLHPMSSSSLEKYLINELEIEEKQAHFLTRISKGCLGWALSALRSDELLKERKKQMDSLSLLPSAGIVQRFEYVRKLSTELSKQKQKTAIIVENVRSWWHDLLIIKGGNREAIVNIDYETMLLQQAEQLSFEEIINFIRCLYEVEDQIKHNVNSRMAFEMLMLNMPRIKIEQAV